VLDNEKEPFKLEDDANLLLHDRRGYIIKFESATQPGNLSVENASGFLPGLSRKS
jgi:predicted Ser/Thr protein kinase